MTTSQGGLDLAGLEALLDTYGADRQRWPEVQRNAVDAMLAASPEARARLAEAQALDRVLALGAPVATSVSATLVDRIMAEALDAKTDGAQQREADQRRGAVIPLKRRPAMPLQPAQAATARESQRRTSTWAAAAVLALALMTGIALGSMEALSGPLGGLGEIVGLEPEADRTLAALQLDGLPSVIDEEQL
ncbi:MAG: hypothetical protein ACKVP7_06240 [Hyphomicrobiaceae bacterium]